MKIAIDIRHLATKNISGVGIYTVNVIKHLAKIAPDIQFILFAVGRKKTLDFIPDWQEKNIQVVKVKMPNKIFSLLLLLGKKMESFLPVKPDLWWFTNENIISTGLPFTITVHDLSFELFPEFFTYKQNWRHKILNLKKISQSASNILAVSENTKHDLVDLWGIDATKIFVTPLACSSKCSHKPQRHDFNRLKELYIDNPYFLVLSNLEPRKNIESIIEAYGRFVDNNDYDSVPDLIIAGAEGYKNKIKLFIEKSEVKEKIKSLGYITEAQKIVLLRRANILLFPSYYEGFGLPCLEAMKSGTPVIASFTGSVPELVKKAGVLVDPYNVSDLVQAMEIVSSNSDYFIKNGLSEAKKFNWEKTSQLTLVVLKNSR